MTGTHPDPRLAAYLYLTYKKKVRWHLSSAFASCANPRAPSNLRVLTGSMCLVHPLLAPMLRASGLDTVRLAGGSQSIAERDHFHSECCAGVCRTRKLRMRWLCLCVLDWMHTGEPCSSTRNLPCHANRYTCGFKTAQPYLDRHRFVVCGAEVLPQCRIFTSCRAIVGQQIHADQTPQLSRTLGYGIEILFSIRHARHKRGANYKGNIHR